MRTVISAVHHHGDNRALLFIEERIEDFREERFDSARALRKSGVHFNCAVKIDLLIQNIEGTVEYPVLSIGLMRY